MTIIDAQVHVWPPETAERPYIKEDASKPHRLVAFEYPDLLGEMTAAGVDRVILVPPSWEGYRNDYALEAAQKYPDRFAVMGKVPLNDSASEAKMASWLKQPGMLGFRISFRHAGTHSWLEDGTADWFWAAAEKYDIPVMVFAPFAVKKIGKIAGRHPGLRVIVDHMGLNVQWRGKDLAPGVDVLLRFARFKNVAVKASCLPCYVDEPYPFPKLHPQIRRVVEAFGSERVFWGTDLSQLPCCYRQAVMLFTEELDFLSTSDKEWIMGRAIAQWLNWPVPARK
ncbi:MAG TPA: amidohydrolase family protein [Verrucomicrobiae bacterium]|nr:amidohydrolase family protein [Verrucomicrobiae bacterium]